MYMLKEYRVITDEKKTGKTIFWLKMYAFVRSKRKINYSEYYKEHVSLKYWHWDLDNEINLVPLPHVWYQCPTQI